MSLIEILNQVNNSYYYLNDTNLGFNKRKWIVESFNPKNNYKTDNKFGFWNTSKTIEINEEVKYKPIKSIKLTNQKFPFLSDPYLDIENEEKIIEISKPLKITDPYLQDKEKEKILPDIPAKSFDLHEELMNQDQMEYSNNDLILMLNYKNERLFDVINTFDNYVSKHKDKDLILMELSCNVLKSKLYGKKLKHWIENFPNMIDDKIKAIKNKIKPKNEKLSKAKTKEYYDDKVISELRFKTVNRMLEARHYYNVNSDLIKGRMKVLHNSLNLDIVNDIIANLDKEVDNDMIEFDDNKLFQEHIKEMQLRYKDSDQFE